MQYVYVSFYAFIYDYIYIDRYTALCTFNTAEGIYEQVALCIYSSNNEWYHVMAFGKEGMYKYIQLGFASGFFSMQPIPLFASIYIV